MKIFKFGGASVKNAESFSSVTNILNNQTAKHDTLVIVISAMGKTTNLLEKLTDAYFEHNIEEVKNLYKQTRDFHYLQSIKLFGVASLKHIEIMDILYKLNERLQQNVSDNYDYEYDQIVSYGELLSSRFLSSFLEINGFSNTLLDSRKIIITDSSYRSASIKWDITKTNIDSKIKAHPGNIYVTQGFIGGTEDKTTTTLGREGSDFSASIFAFCTDAKEVTVWKDVPGILNADPLFFPDAVKIDFLSYHDAIELAYYGAKVIHPKTVKPLQNKGIPLYVKSFIQPSGTGTKISEVSSHTKVPSFIIKKQLILLTISPKDFSFVTEKSLSFIFALIADNSLKINMMQNSALSFSLCLDTNSRIKNIIQALSIDFSVKYNENTELITIWHYNDNTISTLLKNKTVLLEERTRHTVQFLVKG
ncbi:MAG: aspartate kinase [Spirochaetes bacterium]|nr:aspartate kinase [Spirochaetota bacterium]MBN2771173.1 aspartate kinase [Spirochaetota bacterium]